MGFGVIINMGYRFKFEPEDSYPFRHGVLEQYYTHLYAEFWNVTVPDFFVYGHLGGVQDGVGDKADGGVAEGDGDGWRRRRAELAAALSEQDKALVQAEFARVALGAAAHQLA
jgi:hypothetical protein